MWNVECEWLMRFPNPDATLHSKNILSGKEIGDFVFDITICNTSGTPFTLSISDWLMVSDVVVFWLSVKTLSSSGFWGISSSGTISQLSSRSLVFDRRGWFWDVFLNQFEIIESCDERNIKKHNVSLSINFDIGILINQLQVSTREVLVYVKKSSKIISDYQENTFHLCY